MTTEVRETEQKYEVEGDVALPSLADLPQVATVSEPEQETLTAEYYDTDDLRLLKAGITLRRREGGADEGWHLKLPDAAEGPPDDGGRIAPPGDPADPRPGRPRPGWTGAARAAAIRCRPSSRAWSGRTPGTPRSRPVARIETRRRLTTLLDAAGTSLAEIARGRGGGAEPGRVDHPVPLERGRDRADRRPPAAAAGGRRAPAPQRAAAGRPLGQA